MPGVSDRGRRTLRGNQLWISVTGLIFCVLFASLPAQADVSIVNLQEGQEGWKVLPGTTSIVEVRVLHEGIAGAEASTSPDGARTIHLQCNSRGIALVQYTRVDYKKNSEINLIAVACGVGVTVLRRNIVASLGSTIGIPDESFPTIWSSESRNVIEVERASSGAYAAIARREGTAVVLHAIGPDVFTLDMVRVDKSSASSSNGREGNGQGEGSGGGAGNSGGGKGGDDE